MDAALDTPETPTPFWIDNPVRAAALVGIATLIIITALCGLVLAESDDGILAFAFIGTRFSEGDPEGKTGYDGQFVYFIARDGADAIPYIDGPSLRYQRIVFPLAGRILALGDADLVPWTLVALNIVSLSVGAALVALLLAGMGANPAYGLVYGLWLGSLFAIRFDLNEPLCFALSLAAVWAYRRERYMWTIFLLIIATLTKELGAVFAAGLAFHAFWNGKIQWSLLIFGGPVLAFLTWWVVMRAWLGTFPTRYPAAKIHFIPLQGMFTVENPVELTLLAIFLGIPAVVLVLAALWTIWQRKRVTLAAALVLAGAGFVITMPDVSWQDQVAAYRVGLPLILTGLLFVGYHAPQRLRWLAGLWLPASLILLLLPELWLGT